MKIDFLEDNQTATLDFTPEIDFKEQVIPEIRAAKETDQLIPLTAEQTHFIDLKRELAWRQKHPAPEWSLQYTRPGAFLEGLVPTQEGAETRELFPGATGMGKLAQTILLAGPIAKATAGAVPFIENAIPMAKQLFPTSIRILSHTIHSGIVGAGVGAIQETGEQLAKEKIEPGKIAKEAGWSALSWAPWGLVPGSKIGAEEKGLLSKFFSFQRAAVSGVTVGSSTLLIDAIRNKGVNQESLIDATINGITAAVLQGWKGRQIAEAWKNQEINDFLDTKIYQKVKALNPQLTDEEAKAISIACRYGIYNQPAIIEKVSQAVERKIDLENKIEKVTKDTFGEELSKMQAEAKPKLKSKTPKIKYVDIKLSDEDNAICDIILKDIQGAQPGNRYVTRDEETGEVAKVGYEPSDYEYLGYWPVGFSGDNVRRIVEKARQGRATEKQVNALGVLLGKYKEYKNEQAEIELKLQAEGVNQPTIDQVKRDGETEAAGIAEAEHAQLAKEDPLAFLEIEARKMSTGDLEKFLDSRYEVNAPQEELDVLETVYAERVSEDEQALSEEQVQGASLEDQLANMYHRLINPQYRSGMEMPDILANMRAAAESYPGFKKETTDEQLVAAAKDIYEVKQARIKRYKAKQASTPTEGKLIDVKPAVSPGGLRAKEDQTDQQTLLTDIKKGLSPETQGNFFGSKASLPLDKAESVQGTPPPAKTPEQFKLFEAVEKLIKKYASRFGEQYVPGGYAGVYFKDTGNIFLQAINSVSTAVHEITHFLDNKLGITEKVTRTIGTSKSGNPIYDPATLPIRKAFTTIYTKYYPGGRADHKLSKRITEGLATLFEAYALAPEATKQEFPLLVHAFFGGGEFYHNETTNLIRDVRNDLIAPYQKLDDLSKVGARVNSGDRTVVKDQFLNWKEKVLKEFFDIVYPVEKIDKETGVQWTKDSASLYTRMYSNVNAIILNNIVGHKGYWTLGPDLSFVKLFDYNWNTLVELLQNGKNTDTFCWWLVARREKFEYDRLDVLAKRAQEALDDYKAGQINQTEMKEAVNAFKRLNAVLKRDGFDRGVVERSYQEHHTRFAKEEAMFDGLVRADLDMAYKAGKVSPKLYAELTSTYGYAPFQRDFKNEILGESVEGFLHLPRVGKTNIASLKARSGSEATIDNPVHAAMLNHAETVKKSLRQVVYNKILPLVPKINALYDPNQPIFQILPLQRSIDNQGRVFYPQERDPHIIMAQIEGKRVPILVDKTVKACIDECLNPGNINAFEKILATASRTFVKGTTGLFPGFTVTNFLVDQITAAAQTQTRLKPIISPLKELAIILTNDKSQEARLFQEYLILGGERQTFTNLYDLSANDLFNALNHEATGLQKVLELLNAGVNILAIPAKYSEILTRGAEYVRSRMAGEHQVVALERAARVTATFSHFGRWGGSKYIKGLPFFNASLQVLAQYGRTLNDPKSRTRALVVLAALTAGMVGSLAYLMSNGTEEQKRRYKNLNPNDLANYLWFPAPDGVHLLNFKLPEQMAMIGALINMGLADHFLKTQYNAGERLNVATAWIPDQLDPTSPMRMFVSWLPQVMMPGLSVITNTRFWPQLRPLEGARMQGLPPGMRYTESTSLLAKALGAKLNISPIKIDALVEGYLGRAVKMLTIKKMGLPIIREMYFNSTRNLQFYYDVKQQNDIDWKAKEGMSIEQQRQVLQIHNRLKTIDQRLDIFKKLTPSDQEDSFYIRVRNQILDDIDTLRSDFK